MKILCAEPQNYSKKGLALLAKKNDIVEKRMTQAEFKKKSKNFEVLMVRLQLKVTKEMMHSNLKAIITPTTGLDHIDIAEAKKRKIQIFSLAGETEFLENITSTAEHTLAIMLSLIRKIPAAVKSTKNGEWEPSKFHGLQLSGKTLGIIGCGRVGRMMAAYGRALKMTVFCYDPFQKNYTKDIDVICKTLPALLEFCSIVTVHVPLNKSTKHLIGEKELSRMKGGAYIVNTSRGEIIDERAMLRSLASKHLAGAAVDVITDKNRNLIMDYERTHDNLIITPHIAGAAEDAIMETDCFVIHKFIEWAKK